MASAHKVIGGLKIEPANSTTRHFWAHKFAVSKSTIHKQLAMMGSNGTAKAAQELRVA
jgi:hypothetical protein